MSDSNEYDPWNTLAEELGLEVKKAAPPAPAVPTAKVPAPEPEVAQPVAAVEMDEPPAQRGRPRKPVLEEAPDELSFAALPVHITETSVPAVEPEIVEPIEAVAESTEAEESAPVEEAGPRRRGRRGRRGAKGKTEPVADAEATREDTISDVAASNVAEIDSHEAASLEIVGDLNTEEAGDEEVGEEGAEPGGRPKRRRRRRKKPGEREAAPATPVVSQVMPKPAKVEDDVDEPEVEEIVPVRSTKQMVVDDDVDDLSTWTGPSWNELIASLYRPDR